MQKGDAIAFCVPLRLSFLFAWLSASYRDKVRIVDAANLAVAVKDWQISLVGRIDLEMIEQSGISE